MYCSFENPKSISETRDEILQPTGTNISEAEYKAIDSKETWLTKDCYILFRWEILSQTQEIAALWDVIPVLPDLPIFQEGSELGISCKVS